MKPSLILLCLVVNLLPGMSDFTSWNGWFYHLEWVILPPGVVKRLILRWMARFWPKVECIHWNPTFDKKHNLKDIKLNSSVHKLSFTVVVMAGRCSRVCWRVCSHGRLWWLNGRKLKIIHSNYYINEQIWVKCQIEMSHNDGWTGVDWFDGFNCSNWSLLRPNFT